VFSISSIFEGIQEKMANMLGLKYIDLPVAYIIENPSSKPVHYKINTFDNLEEFIIEWKNKRLSPYYKSEPIPSGAGGPIVKIVGKTYSNLIKDGDKDALVLFTAPWCNHCIEFKKVYEKIAKKIEGAHMLFGLIDYSLNEVEGVEITEYPTIMFYPGRSKK